jgi:hypothetical protein
MLPRCSIDRFPLHRHFLLCNLLHNWVHRKSVTFKCNQVESKIELAEDISILDYMITSITQGWFIACMVYMWAIVELAQVS